MKLDIKLEEDFNQVLAISDESFAGVERPPRSILRAHFYADDIFVLRDQTTLDIYAFAIVTERQGPYVFSVAVTPRYRKTGEGTCIMNEIALYYAQAGRKDIALTCKTGNPAQKLYFDLGYRVEKVLQRYYGAEGSGLYMRREL